MELTVAKNELTNAIGRVIGAVEKRPSMPILSHIKLTAHGSDYLQLAATDLMTYARTECPAEVGVEGSIAVPAEKLKAAVDKCGDELHLSLDENCRLSIDSDGLFYDIASLDAADFPEPFGGDLEWLYSLAHGILPGIVNSLRHAVCSDECKSHICGIYLLSDSGRITACATDGHRLAVAGRDIPGTEHKPGAFIVPARACNMLARINSSIDLSLAPKHNLVQFSSGRTDLCSRLLEGKFPAFRAVIPGYLDKGCTVQIERLVTALDACGVMAEDKSKTVQLDGRNGFLKLSALGATGTASVSVPYLGDDGLTLCLNSRYLLQAVKSMPGDEIFLRYKDALSPILLIPVDHGLWDERLEVIMPLRP